MSSQLWRCGSVGYTVPHEMDMDMEPKRGRSGSRDHLLVEVRTRELTVGRDEIVRDAGLVARRDEVGHVLQLHGV